MQHAVQRNDLTNSIMLSSHVLTTIQIAQLTEQETGQEIEQEIEQKSTVTMD
jgi:hypothetical protein